MKTNVNFLLILHVHYWLPGGCSICFLSEKEANEIINIWNVAGCVNEKYCLPYQLTKDAAAIPYSCPLAGEPWENAECEPCPLLQSPPFPLCTLRRLMIRKHRILATNSVVSYQRNDFSEPRHSDLPIGRKTLNSLTWYNRFSLINSNLDATNIWSFATKVPVYLGFNVASFGQFLRIIWNAVSQA